MNNQKTLQHIQTKLNELEISLRQNLETIETLQAQIKRLIRKDKPITEKRRASKKNLIVTMQDGYRISFSTGVDTFMATIERIRIEKVRCLNIIRANIPLITPHRFEGTYQQQRISSDGMHWITIHGSTEQKASCLREIDSRLKLKMKVEIVES